MIRGFAGRQLIFEEPAEVTPAELATLVSTLAVKHAAGMKALPRNMIEIEFLDEPDPNQRFWRFGTDPAGMVAPIAIPLDKISHRSLKAPKSIT